MFFTQEETSFVFNCIKVLLQLGPALQIYQNTSTLKHPMFKCSTSVKLFIDCDLQTLIYAYKMIKNANKDVFGLKSSACKQP